MSGQRRYLRDTFNGKLLGVCAGFGDYLGIDPLWVRLGFVLATFMLFPPLIFIYFLIAMITNKKPPESYTDNLSRVFDEPYDPKPASRKGDEQ